MAKLTGVLIESNPGGLPLIGVQGYRSNQSVTLGDAASLDLSAASGSVKLPTGGMTAAGVTSAIDLSGATGGFKFPTGATSGQQAAVVSGSGATVTLTAAQSGSLVLFDRAAGIVFTLPAPTVGLTFTFIVTVTITSNNAKVITDAGTTLIQGSVQLATTAAAPNTYFGNGTTHLALTQNGTTTGGILGSMLTLECVSATLWQASGSLNGSGTLATPFATS